MVIFMFKKKDMLLVAAVLLIAGIMAVIFYLPDKKEGNMLCVMVDGKEYGRYIGARSGVFSGANEGD